MMIDKEASGSKNRTNSIYFTESCRDAIKQILMSDFNSKKILIPAYVGLSLEEGSGILDPIIESKTDFEFYDVDENLDPDLGSLESMLNRFNPTHVLIVNYFGFLCSNRVDVFELLSNYSVVIIEDFAHLIDPLNGNRQISQMSDFEVISLHKTIGAGVGGGALISRCSNENFKDTISNDSLKTFAKSDLVYISEMRLRNYEYLNLSISQINCDCMTPFFPEERRPISPLNYPLRIRNVEMRHELYLLLVEAGIRPTALYHRLVKELDSKRFSISLNISQRILNLPTHQDVQIAELDTMMEKIRKFCSGH